MKPFIIKLKRKGISKNSGYEIVVTSNINRANPDVLEILGIYNPNYPVRFNFINMEKFSGWCVKGAFVNYSILKLISTLHS